MSRYDRQRERKRLLIVGALVIAFFAGVFLWGRSLNNGEGEEDRIAEQVGR